MKLIKVLALSENKLQDCALKVTTWYDLNYHRGNFKKYGLFSRNKGENEIEMKLMGHRRNHIIILLN